MHARNLGLLSLALSVSAGAEVATAPADIGCYRATHGRACILAWNFAATPRTYYWIQSFDVPHRRWVDFAGPTTDPFSKSRETIARGTAVRTARFMSSRILALVEHPADENSARRYAGDGEGED